MTDNRLEQLRRNDTFLTNQSEAWKIFDQKLREKIQINAIRESSGLLNLVLEDDTDQWKLHRETDPFGEFKDQLARLKNQPEILVCFGTGFGYQFPQSLPYFNQCREVILADSCFESLFLFLTECDLASLFPDADVRVVYAPDSAFVTTHIVSRFKRYSGTNVEFVALESIARKQEQFIESIADAVRSTWKKQAIYIKTMEDQYAEVQSHALANMTDSRDSATLSADSHKGETAVLIASGPSAELFLPYAEALRGRVTTFACGSALSLMLAKNVRPDFVLVNDPQRINDQHFPEDRYDLPLIYDPIISPAIVARFSGPRIAFCSGYDVVRLFARHLRMVEVECWGTISSAALGVARYMGFRQIALTGMDFSYRNNRTHAGNYQLSTRTERRIHVLDRIGRYVETTTTLQDYAEYFNRQCAALQCEGTEIISLMDGGLVTSGTGLTPRNFFHQNRHNRLSRWTHERLQPLNTSRAALQALTREIQMLKETARLNIQQFDVRNDTVNLLFLEEAMRIVEGDALEAAKLLEQAQIDGDDKRAQDYVEKVAKDVESAWERLSDAVRVIAENVGIDVERP